MECIGLAAGDRAEFARLIEQTLSSADLIAKVNRTSVYAWQDPSGARLVISTEDRQIVDLLPSFAGTVGALLSGVKVANDEVAVGKVVDDEGETMTMLAIELEQRRMLAGAAPAGGAASIVALGNEVSVFADKDSFANSDASLISPGKDAGDPPAHVAELGMSWPPRMAAESFMSYGVFGPPEQAQAHAWLYGTVLTAQTRTTQLTGQSFITTRVRTVGFEVDLCLPATSAVPEPGNIIGGHVFLVASMPSLLGSDAARSSKRSWLPWRRGPRTSAS